MSIRFPVTNSTVICSTQFSPHTQTHKHIHIRVVTRKYHCTLRHSLSRPSAQNIFGLNSFSLYPLFLPVSPRAVCTALLSPFPRSYYPLGRHLTKTACFLGDTRKCTPAHTTVRSFPQVYFRCNGERAERSQQQDFVDPRTGTRVVEVELNVTRNEVEEYFGRERFKCECVAWSGPGQIRGQPATVEVACK